MKIDAFLQTCHIPPADPRLDRKRKAIEGLHMTLAKTPEAADIVDLSGLEKVDAQTLERIASGAKRTLIAPQHQAEAMKLSEALRKKMLTALPFRCWGVAEKTKTFRENDSAGGLVSFRLFYNAPKRKAHSSEEFAQKLLPELLDLCEEIAGAKAEKLHLNTVPGSNNVFGLLQLEGNVVAELDVNESLPDSLDTIRFVHAYFNDGAITNLPLAGFTNFEGNLLATGAGTRMDVHESVDCQETDEIENLYFRMLWHIRRNEYFVKPSRHFDLLRRLAEDSLKTAGTATACKEDAQ